MALDELNSPLVERSEAADEALLESSFVVVEPGQMPEFVKRLDRLNARAKKFDLPPIEILSNERTIYQRHSETVGRDSDRVVNTLRRVPEGAMVPEPVFMQRIQLRYPEVRLGNWRVVGRIEAVGAGNLMFTVTDLASDRDAVRQAADHPIDCEHCNTKRKRKEGFVLRDLADGAYKRVGSTCLEDFTGIDPAAALFLAKMYEVVRLSEGELDEFAGSGRQNAVGTRDFLTRVAFLVSQGGFVSAQRARDEMLEATFSSALGLGQELAASRTLMQKYANGLDSNRAVADAVLQWYATKPVESDFDRNVQLILSEEAISLDRRHLALAAAALAMHARHLQAEAERAKPSSHVGEVGGKHKSLLTVDRVVAVHNIFRHADDYLVLFKDGEGNQLKWKTSAAPKELVDGAGKTLEATFKIKDHKDYKGVAQTSVSHLKVLRWVDAENAALNSLYDAESEAEATATPESVRQAIADLVRVEPDDLEEGVGRIVVTTSAEAAAANFSRWFDGSCVADESGSPLMVFHGTGNLDGLHQFDPAMTGKGNDQVGSGFYFTTNAEEASGYATAVTANAGVGARKLGGDESPGVLAAYLAIKNPIVVRGSNLRDADIELTHKQAVQIINRAPNIRDLDETPLGDHLDVWSVGRVTDKMISDVAKLYTGPSLMSLENDFFRSNSTAFRHAVHEATGHDGVVMEFNGGHKHFVAWFPEQIKSALGNRGTYDPKNPDIRHSLAGLDPRAQAWHDVATNTTVFLADRIPAGKEASVFLHEIVHRHGRQALPEGQWGALVGQVKAWAQAEPQSPERAIHDAAAARVATAGVAGALADEELFAYAVEEAVARGVEPTAAAIEGSAAAWLQAVVESIQRVSDKLLGNDLKELSGQDLVDLAYALAQLDSPEHGVDVRRALQEETVARLEGDLPIVSDVYGDQIQVNGTWFHAERIFGRPASTYGVGDSVPQLAEGKRARIEEPDEVVSSDLFRESGANITDERKLEAYAQAMREYGGWGDFPPCVGRVEVVFEADVDRFEEMAESGTAHELGFSRALERNDVGRRYIHLENGHHRSYAAQQSGIGIPVFDLNVQERGRDFIGFAEGPTP